MEEETPRVQPKETIPHEKKPDLKQQAPTPGTPDKIMRPNEELPRKKNEAEFLPEATIDLSAITRMPGIRNHSIFSHP